jgi:hypothetical protein
MGDNYGRAAAATVPAFTVAPYVLLISYLALVLVLFADLLDMLACLYVVKLTSAYLLLTSIIKLTKKLLNILLVYMFFCEFYLKLFIMLLLFHKHRVYVPTCKLCLVSVLGS